MKKTTFTDTGIRKLKPEESDYCRSEGNGFTIRVLPSGSKTWLYLYTLDGKRRKMNLGNYPDISLETARNRFEDAKRKVKNGIDPVAEAEQAAEERIKAPTVAMLINEYIEKHVKVKKRGWQDDKTGKRHEDERILNKDALREWGNRKAKDIKKRDVVLLLEKIIERGSPGSANGNFKCIRKMFNFAVERDILEYSPCTGVKMPAPLNIRERALSEQEIQTLWKNLDTASISDDIKAALRLILLTGQRPGEVIGMHTGEIDGDWWTIPAERSKNKKTHRVFLTATVKQIIDESIARIRVLREIPSETEYSGFVFPCPHATKIQPIAVNALAHAIRRNLEWPVTVNGNPVYDKAGNPVTENRLGIDQFTPHDLRRTTATFMSKLGFMDEIIDAVLNHVKKGIIKTYNQNKYQTEKQSALETWERKLTSIITGESAGKVISIQQGKRKAA